MNISNPPYIQLYNAYSSTVFPVNLDWGWESGSDSWDTVLTQLILMPGRYYITYSYRVEAAANPCDFQICVNGVAVATIVNKNNEAILWTNTTQNLKTGDVVTLQIKCSTFSQKGYVDNYKLGGTITRLVTPILAINV